MTRMEQIVAWVRQALEQSARGGTALLESEAWEISRQIEWAPQPRLTFDVLVTGVACLALCADWPDWDQLAADVDAAARPYERGEPGRYTYSLEGQQ